MRGPAVVAALVSILAAGCGASYLHVIRVESDGEPGKPWEPIRAVATPVTDRLIDGGFECRVEYGHTLFHAACSRNERTGIGWTTDSWIFVHHPEPDGALEIEVRTGQMAYHPLTGEFRDVFERRRDEVLAIVGGLPGVAHTDREVD
jgi:hypothetical protein